MGGSDVHNQRWIYGMISEKTLQLKKMGFRSNPPNPLRTDKLYTL